MAPPVSGLQKAFKRYRVMAFVVGVGLLIVVFIGIPLQFGAGQPAVADIVGTIHGYLYIVYLLTAVDLGRRARFTIPQMLAMIGAGFLPFLAFYIEHRVNLRVQDILAAEAAGESLPGTTWPTTIVTPPVLRDRGPDGG